MAPVNKADTDVRRREAGSAAAQAEPEAEQALFPSLNFKGLMLSARANLIRRSPLVRYGFALAMLVLATAGRWLCDPQVGDHHLFPTFIVALIVTAWFAGTGPAILSMVLGFAAADFFFVHPRLTFSKLPREHEVGLLLYAFVGVAHITTNHLFRAAQRELEHRTRQLTRINTALEQEIAERKRVEAEVRRLATVVSSSMDSILGIALDGTVTDWNAGSMELYGYARTEIIGQPIVRLIPEDRSTELEQVLQRIRRGAGVEPFETVRCRKDGETIAASVSFSVIRGDDGAIIGAAEIARDLTATKRLEEQFRQAQKMEAVGRLAGGIAHDFNNILMIITGLSEMIMAQAQADDPLRQYSAEIKEAADRATSLTNQLLTFSRRQIVAPKVLDANTLITNMDMLLRRAVGEHTELVLDLEPGSGCVKVDPNQFEQVLVNLVLNARDAMPLGGVLTITTREVTRQSAARGKDGDVPGGRFVVITVRDTGCGMNKEVKSHLFEPFFTTKGPEKGTGLGLAMVYGIVQQSGGHVRVHSEPGRGTAIEIYLPHAEGAPAGRTAPVAVEAAGGAESILLVEDETVLRRLARRMLESKGYRVLDAGGGPEALEIISRHSGRFDLLITDVVMPQMSGRQLAVELDRRSPGIHVLYLSGYTDDEVVRHGVLHERMNFLSKPCSLEALALKVREILDGRGHQ
jgi:PAS domain S-box-containing protein